MQDKPSCFENEYWRKIGALTNEYLNIFYRVPDAVDKAGDNFGTEVDHLYTLNITLPSLILWEKNKDLSSMVVVDFSGLTEEQIYECFEFSVQAIKQSLDLCDMAGYLGFETRKSFQAKAPQITYKERQTSRDEEQKFVFDSIIYNPKG